MAKLVAFLSFSVVCLLVILLNNDLVVFASVITVNRADDICRKGEPCGSYEQKVDALFDAFEDDDELKVTSLIKGGHLSPDVRTKSCCSYANPTALICAACKGAFKSVKALIKNGASLEARDIDGGTALIWAARIGYEDIVQLLLEKGADIDARTARYGDTALTFAAFNGNLATVRVLLEAGADLEAKQRAGKNALMLARDSGYEDIAELLESAAKFRLPITTAEKT